MDLSLLNSPQLGAPDAVYLLAHLLRVTQALAAVRQPNEVFDIILNDGLTALNAISGTVLIVQGGRLHVTARKGQDTASIWQDGDLEGHRPSPDALRSNTPLFFRKAGELVAAYPDLEARTGGVAAVANAVLPMVEGGRPLGVIVLDFEAPHEFTPDEEYFLRTLAGQCALALERTQLSRTLERQAQGRAAELEAFVQFSELADTETDVLVLSGRVVDMLGVLFPGCTSVYYALESGRWRAKVHTDDLEANPGLLGAIQAGMPLDTPLFAEAMRTGEPVFVEGWNPEVEQFAQTEAYQSVAVYPLSMEGTLQAMFALGVKDQPHWSPHHQAVFRAVGRSLGLALERTETARRLAAQNAELLARTQALEGVARLSGDLVGGGDHLTLVQRTQHLVLSLLPPGYAAYFENVEGRWRAQVQVGDVGNPALQQAIDAGFPVGRTPTLDHCTQTLEPYFIEAYAPDTDIDPEVAGHLRAAACLPVMVGGRVIGIFNVPLFNERRWDAADKALLVTAVHSLGLTLERAQSVFALARRTEELERSNAELAQFAYVASHDLQEPLRTITSFSQLLSRRYGGQLDERADSYIQFIGDATARMGTLLQDLLAFSRVGSAPMQHRPVDLRVLMEQVLQDLQAQVDQTGARVVVGPLPTVPGDATQLRQLFQNLIGNALKFHHPERAPDVQIVAQEHGSYVTVRIADNGIGIAPDYFERIFTIFQRLHTRETYEGSGMGLAIARKIVERHGGRVWLESTPGHGTTFQVSLPAEGS
ncbi:hypothetical protein GCM10008949_17060 [Deinococcus humi]|nr:hypothetical protein GCM10008949_17060 [Deinococcus humi]